MTASATTMANKERHARIYAGHVVNHLLLAVWSVLFILHWSFCLLQHHERNMQRMKIVSHLNGLNSLQMAARQQACMGHSYYQCNKVGALCRWLITMLTGIVQYFSLAIGGHIGVQIVVACEWGFHLPSFYIALAVLLSFVLPDSNSLLTCSAGQHLNKTSVRSVKSSRCIKL